MVYFVKLQKKGHGAVTVPVWGRVYPRSPAGTHDQPTTPFPSALPSERTLWTRDQRGTCWLISRPHAGARCGSICSVLSLHLFNLLEVDDQPEQPGDVRRGYRGHLIPWDLRKLAAGKKGASSDTDQLQGPSLHDFSLRLAWTLALVSFGQVGFRGLLPRSASGVGRG